MAAPAITDRAPSDPKDAGTGSKDSAFIAQAVKRWNRANENEAINRQEAMEDDKFRAGDQWPAQIKSERTLQQRPCLTINKIGTFVKQITNQQRMNRPAGNIAPIGDKSDVETAKMIKGWFRQIERCGGAEDAYDAGFESGVCGGWGYWRVQTDYEEGSTFNQIIKFERIDNRFSVYVDPTSKLPTAADAEWMFISEFMTREQFEREYPKADPVEWTEYGTGDEIKEWNTQTHIRIAEYFYFEYKKRTLIALKSGHIGFEDLLAQEVKDAIAADPSLVANRREVDDKQLKWCKLTCKEILDETEWKGKYIPIVRVIGDETVVAGKVNYAGVVRHAKDPQRMYNYWSTAETEMIALQPKAPWIMEEGQIEGHEQRWKKANVVPMPYLLYKGSSIGGKPAPPPQRQPFQGSPDGVVKAKIGAAQDMQATTGIRFDATLQERMNDESGKALVELKRIGEMGQYHFTDNFAKSLKHTWEILLDLAPKIYDLKRVITILREDDSEEQVAVDPNQAEGQKQEQTPDGRVRRVFNPNIGKYGVAVTVGPNYATKRQEAGEQMIQFLKFLPQTAPLVADLVAKNMDWPDAEIFQERLASQLPPNLLMKNLQNMPPQARAMIGSLQQQLQKLSEEHKQALHMLGEKNTETQQTQQKIDDQRTKIDNDFTAKMAAVSVSLETAMTKSQTEHGKLIGDIVQKMADISMAVEQFRHERDITNEEHSLQRDQMEYDRQDKEQERSNDMGQVKEALDKLAKRPKVTKVEAVKKGSNTSALLHYDDGTSRHVPIAKMH